MSTNYRCLAEIDLPLANLEKYEATLYLARDVFLRNGWDIELNLLYNQWSPGSNADPVIEAKAQGTTLHLWSIPDFDSLAMVMALAADNSHYVDSEQLIDGERQNLYTILPYDPAFLNPELPLPKAKHYMLECLHLGRAPGPRSDLLFRMSHAVVEMDSKFGWKLAFAGNAATGVIDQYINIWAMDTISDEAEVYYRKGPNPWSEAWSKAVTSVDVRWWLGRDLPELPK